MYTQAHVCPASVYRTEARCINTGHGQNRAAGGAAASQMCSRAPRMFLHSRRGTCDAFLLASGRVSPLLAGGGGGGGGGSGRTAGVLTPVARRCSCQPLHVPPSEMRFSAASTGVSTRPFRGGTASVPSLVPVGVENVQLMRHSSPAGGQGHREKAD